MKTSKDLRLLDRVNGNKEIQKAIGEYYNSERFVKDAKRYIKAIKEGRMINSIGKVSASGMSRTLKFLSCEKVNSGYQYHNYFAFMLALGFSPADRSSHYFRVNGCGMDMIFYTNYTIIHRLRHLGFISKKQCDHLAQQTPQTI